MRTMYTYQHAFMRIYCTRWARLAGAYAYSYAAWPKRACPVRIPGSDAGRTRPDRAHERSVYVHILHVTGPLHISRDPRSICCIVITYLLGTYFARGSTVRCGKCTYPERVCVHFMYVTVHIFYASSRDAHRGRPCARAPGEKKDAPTRMGRCVLRAIARRSD